MPPAPNDPADSPAPFPVYPVPPELLAWARQTVNVEEFEREMREVLENGGCTFESFIDELEARARGS